MALLCEGCAIQNQLAKSNGHSRKDHEVVAHSFASLIHQGRIISALRMVDISQTRGGVLSLDMIVPDTGKTVQQVLKEKHPRAEVPEPYALLSGVGQQTTGYHPVIFQQVTAETIRAAALRLQGRAGLSGIDAYGWRRLVTSLGKVSDDLCRALADFTRRICSERVPGDNLAAYVAC